MKVCTLCKETKPLDAFFRRSNRKSGLQSKCKACHLAASRESKRLWAQRNQEKSKKWQTENKAAYCATVNARQARERLELGDGYVRNVIASRSGCKRADVPADLVNAKRAWLAATRIIKEKSQ